tara:strand:+ start:394 stop:717 length:324 start_codon:yes stop_codon:yes gene_type:complete
MDSLEKKWDDLIDKLEGQFGEEMTLKGVLYLIGVQELNFGIKQYDREEKINVLHVGTCKVLSSFGYYKFDSIDNDGWPHYIELKPLMSLSAKNQENLIKEAILKYLS